MIQVIPTIIAKDFQELQEKIKKVEPYVDWVQLDVMDGQFVDNTTWNNPQELETAVKEMSFGGSLRLEVHLMVKNPEEVIGDWIKSGVRRIIFHYESTDKSQEIIERIKKAGLEVGIAINPETPIEVLDPFLPVSLILIMTVHPGRGGQQFLEETLDKIKQLREKYKDVNIEVDGGINLETTSKVIQAGANLLASGSAIFNSDDIKGTIQALKQNDK